MEERYSRQILTLGRDAQNSLNNGSVLVSGISKLLGVEVCKNLVLQGVGNIYILNEGVIENEEIYYYNKKKGELKHKVLLERLKRMNPYINIKEYENEDIDIIICLDNIEELSKLGKPIIYSLTNKNKGFILNDFLSYEIIDIDGEEREDMLILKMYENILELERDHNLIDNDIIELRNLRGDLLNIKERYKINVVDNKSIKLLGEKIEGKLLSGYCRREERRERVIFNNINEELIKERDYILCFNEEYNICVDSFFGGLIVSECIKYLTKKLRPINGWYKWEDEMLDYDLSRLNVLIVGAGAIGCELLKNLVCMGVRNITITDPDKIEESNLSRQFLFNESHLNKYKSECARESVLSFRDDLNIKSLIEKVGKGDKFDNIFYEGIDVVFNALDNIEARLHMDNMCIRYKKGLFDSGTQGSRGSTQVVIPYITEHYGAQEDMVVEESYPVCTVKSYPNKVEHVIHWGMEKFKNIFSDLLESEMSDFYRKYFIMDIRELLNEHPEDEKIEGEYFWSNGKRCPKELDESNLEEFIRLSNRLLERGKLEFDKDDNEMMDWVYLVSKLRCENYGIEIVDRLKTKKIVGKIIPAVATTTSIVSGLICYELYKYMNKMGKEKYRSYFINTSINEYLYIEPNEMKTVNGVNIWSDLLEREDILLGEFIDRWNKKLGIEIESILNEGKLIYHNFLHTSDIDKSLKELCICNELVLYDEEENEYKIKCDL